MGKSTKKCSPRKHGVKSHNRKGSRRVKSHCRRYKSRSSSRKTRSRRRSTTRKSGCKKGSKRVSFTAKGKKVSFCAKKRSTRRRSTCIRSPRKTTKKRSTQKSPTQTVKKGSLCQGLNNYDCNINPNCMYITDKNNKSYCKGRSDVLKKGNIYQGPMGKPSDYVEPMFPSVNVETSTVPPLPEPMKYTISEGPTPSTGVLFNAPTLI